MEKGWVGARHSHPHEQVVYVVSGQLEVTITGTTFRVARVTALLYAAAWNTRLQLWKTRWSSTFSRRAVRTTYKLWPHKSNQVELHPASCQSSIARRLILPSPWR